MTGFLWTILGFVGGLALTVLGDMVSDEVRARLDHLPHTILRVAARRLSPDDRGTLYEDEWLPELSYILTGDETQPVTRLFHGTCFALGALIAAFRIVSDLNRSATTQPDEPPQAIELDFSAPWRSLAPASDGRVLSPHRITRSAFRAVIVTAYDGHCAITGSKIRPALEAAHIRPVSAGGDATVTNGLLLRSDVHSMFDYGYLTLDPEYKLMVSPRLSADFGGGREFYDMAGKVIALPEQREHWPSQEFLAWHRDNVFKPLPVRNPVPPHR